MVLCPTVDFAQRFYAVQAVLSQGGFPAVKKSDLIVGRDLWRTKPATQMDLYDYTHKQVIPNRLFEKQLRSKLQSLSVAHSCDLMDFSTRRSARSYVELDRKTSRVTANISRYQSQVSDRSYLDYPMITKDFVSFREDLISKFN